MPITRQDIAAICELEDGAVRLIDDDTRDSKEGSLNPLTYSSAAFADHFKTAMSSTVS